MVAAATGRAIGKNNFLSSVTVNIGNDELIGTQIDIVFVHDGRHGVGDVVGRICRIHYAHDVRTVAGFLEDQDTGGIEGNSGVQKIHDAPNDFLFAVVIQVSHGQARPGVLDHIGHAGFPDLNPFARGCQFVLIKPGNQFGIGVVGIVVYNVHIL